MIRKAEIKDIEIILDFQLKMAWTTENIKLDSKTLRKGIQAIFENPHKGQYYVIEIDNVVVGSTLITYEWSDWRNANFIWLQSVYIIPDKRNQKLFSKMYRYVQQLAKYDDSIAGIRLYVNQTNEHAKNVYKSLGMESEHYDTYEWLKQK